MDEDWLCTHGVEGFGRGIASGEQRIGGQVIVDTLSIYSLIV